MNAKGKKRLRSGYTTGACAAAAAKAAVGFLTSGQPVEKVEIPFPDGSRHGFAVRTCSRICGLDGREKYRASVIKDAGDDPDVTNGAEIVVTATRDGDGDGISLDGLIMLRAGAGVGRVTKPGLPVPVGEPAVNPVPRRMIVAAVREALPAGWSRPVFLEVSVTDGESLATRTLNHRLGIIGGLSILGTTGIVRPVSAEAWKATILASMDVAKAAGLREIVLSTGRTSERGAQSLLDLPEEAYAMMGDYLVFSLTEAAKRKFTKIHLAGMWAKIMKAAMEIPQTHVRHGALETADAIRFLDRCGVQKEVLALLAGANTAREIYERLAAVGHQDVILTVCRKARQYAEKVSGLPVCVYLVAAGGRVLCSVP